MEARILFARNSRFSRALMRQRAEVLAELLLPHFHLDRFAKKGGVQ